MPEVLDNAVWHALTTYHAALAEGEGAARRYRPDVSVFWAVDTLDADGWAALAALAGSGRGVFLFRPSLGDPPPGWTPVGGGAAHQMVAAELTRTGAAEPPTAAIRPLTADDVDVMLELTALTEPGPFEAGTIELGDYFGIEEDGRLVAMAGERMRLPGYTEISAVCTHPSARGRGLATVLTRRVADGILERGETPFLHVRHDNDPARRVYERLGFSVRRSVEFRWLRAPG